MWTVSLWSFILVCSLMLIWSLQPADYLYFLDISSLPPLCPYPGSHCVVPTQECVAVIRSPPQACLLSQWPRQGALGFQLCEDWEHLWAFEQPCFLAALFPGLYMSLLLVTVKYQEYTVQLPSRTAGKDLRLHSWRLVLRQLSHVQIFHISYCEETQDVSSCKQR